MADQEYSLVDRELSDEFGNCAGMTLRRKVGQLRVRAELLQRTSNPGFTLQNGNTGDEDDRAVGGSFGPEAAGASAGAVAGVSS
jgi:hypothetical protein